MKPILISIIMVFLMSFWSGNVLALNPGENDKIQFLITSVERLNGATFIRNGSNHTAKEAASHLRLKLRGAGSRIQTANDFITFCASKSSLTGKPYMIRFSDDSITTAEEYFRKILKGHYSLLR